MLTKLSTIFTDYNMPKFDGIYALRNIRQINHQVKVIIISSDKTIETISNNLLPKVSMCA